MDDYIRKQMALDALAKAMPSLTTPDGSGEFDHDIQIADEVFVDSMQVIHDLPSEDVQPVRHGHWDTIEGWDGDELYRCSECGAEFVLIDGTPKDNDYWFCPHCGADMRGDQNG